MKTLTRISPDDHGRRMRYEDFASAEWEDGYQYELIDGRVYVSPLPNLPQGRVERWIYRKLDRYSDERPDVINFVHAKSRVFVRGRRDTTCPEPDVAAYHNFPEDADFGAVRWQDVSPILVVEVLSEDDPLKDLIRNVELYLQVPSVKEYWLIDNREDPNRPTMRVYRRHGKRWRIIEVAFNERYTTKLLPEFELIVNPRR